MKHTTLCAVATCTAILSGCGGSALPSPQPTIDAYISATKRGDHAALHALLSERDRVRLSGSDVATLLKENAEELRSESTKFGGQSTIAEAKAEITFEDGESVTLDFERGLFQIGTAGTLPGGGATPSQAIAGDIVDAYKILIIDEQSNFGWRILLHVLCDEKTQKQVVNESEGGRPMRALLDANFVATHLEAVQLAYSVIVGERAAEAVQLRLKELLGPSADVIMSWLTLNDADDQGVLDQGKPTILLTTYKGCKGLSAGHVFIVGTHDGSLPKDRNAMEDREISQFVVALTRTRKQCHVISNKWFIAPRDGNGQFVAPFEPSPFAEWIPDDFVRDLGNISAKNFR